MTVASRLLFAIAAAFIVSMNYNLFRYGYVEFVPTEVSDLPVVLVWLLLVSSTGWIVWHITRPIGENGDIIPPVKVGAVWIGLFGFIVGFAGPLLIGWGGNQGPMLGIFVTGPGGALIGALLGYAYWMLRENPPEAEDED